MRMSKILLIVLVGGALAMAQSIRVRIAPDSPVVWDGPVAHSIVGAGGTVRNRSQKPIKAITIQIERDGVAREERFAVDLAPGEKGRVTIPIRDSKEQGISGKTVVILSVSSVEFSDGVTWAVPAT